MKTIKEIASAYAHDAVEVDRSDTVYVGPSICKECLSSISANASAERAREHIAGFIVKAIEAYQCDCPVPAGISDKYLAGIIERNRLGGTEDRRREYAAWCRGHVDLTATVAMLLMDRSALIDHIKHLHALMNSPEGQAIASAYEQGKRDARQFGTPVEFAEFVVSIMKADWDHTDRVIEAIKYEFCLECGRKIRHGYETTCHCDNDE